MLWLSYPNGVNNPIGIQDYDDSSRRLEILYQAVVAFTLRVMLYVLSS